QDGGNRCDLWRSALFDGRQVTALHALRIEEHRRDDLRRSGGGCIANHRARSSAPSLALFARRSDDRAAKRIKGTPNLRGAFLRRAKGPYVNAKYRRRLARACLPRSSSPPKSSHHHLRTTAQIGTNYA